MQLDNDQQKIVDSSADNICVIAGAGSGKTRVLTERVFRLLKGGVDPTKIVCITFTRLAANEMKSRLKLVPAASKMFIGTIHAYAMKLHMTYGDRSLKLLVPEIQGKIIEELVNTYAKFASMADVNKYLEYRRQVELNFRQKWELPKELTEDKINEIEVLLDLASPDNKFSADDYPATLSKLAKERGYITFDELLVTARRELAAHNKEIEYLFVDEFQDVGALEYKFLLGLNAHHVFVVGDDYQCQPEWTKVRTCDGSDVSMKSITKSLQIVSGVYDKLSEDIELTTAKVNDRIMYRTDRLIKVITSDAATMYTENHRCIVKFDVEACKHSYALYLIENNSGWFRIGACKLWGKHTATCNLHRECLMNYGKRLWMLGIVDSREIVKGLLKSVKHKYNIPTIRFSNRSRSVQEVKLQVEYDKATVYNAAMECIVDFGHSAAFPFVDLSNPSDRWEQMYSSSGIFEIEASNLIAKYMQVPVLKDNQFEFQNISNVETYHGLEFVYGLTVSDSHLYVGDGVLTHNSIYSFKGADFRYFQKLLSNKNYTAYTLQNNYRSNNAVVKYSNKIIKDCSDVIVKKCKSTSIGPPGKVVHVEGTRKHVENMVRIIDPRNYGKWFILTRNNQQVVTVSRMLYKMGIPSEPLKISNQSPEETQTMLQRNTIKVLTVHASKGLETDNVILYGSFPECMNDEDSSEERRLMYVGITRARNNVYIVDTSNAER